MLLSHLTQFPYGKFPYGKLLEKLGAKRYSVMGTSYGGFVAYTMAKFSAMNRRWKDQLGLLERARVEKVEDLMLPRNAMQLKNLMRVALGKCPPYMPDFFLHDYIKTLYSDNLEEKSELLKGLTFGKDDQIHVSPLQQEVFIVWGEHDQIFPLEKVIELQGILGDKARLEVIKNTSHVPQFEDPKKFNEIVHKFFCEEEITSRYQGIRLKQCAPRKALHKRVGVAGRRPACFHQFAIACNLCS
ncbi:hypothetical protein ACHQM5_009323 [Ranunculus cassubicifolius]